MKRLLISIFSAAVLMGCFLVADAASPPSAANNMYVCSVRNANTGQIFYGKSVKESYAQMYARATCQMKSHSGNCLVKASCDYNSQPLRADE